MRAAMALGPFVVVTIAVGCATPLVFERDVVVGETFSMPGAVLGGPLPPRMVGVATERPVRGPMGSRLHGKFCEEQHDARTCTLFLVALAGHAMNDEHGTPRVEIYAPYVDDDERKRVFAAAWVHLDDAALAATGLVPQRFAHFYEDAGGGVGLIATQVDNVFLVRGHDRANVVYIGDRRGLPDGDVVDWRQNRRALHHGGFEQLLREHAAGPVLVDAAARMTSRREDRGDDLARGTAVVDALFVPLLGAQREAWLTAVAASPSSTLLAMAPHLGSSEGPWQRAFLAEATRRHVNRLLAAGRPLTAAGVAALALTHLGPRNETVPMPRLHQAVFAAIEPLFPFTGLTDTSPVWGALSSRYPAYNATTSRLTPTNTQLTVRYTSDAQSEFVKTGEAIETTNHYDVAAWQLKKRELERTLREASATMTMASKETTYGHVEVPVVEVQSWYIDGQLKTYERDAGSQEVYGDVMTPAAAARYNAASAAYNAAAAELARLGPDPTVKGKVDVGHVVSSGGAVVEVDRGNGDVARVELSAARHPGSALVDEARAFVARETAALGDIAHARARAITARLQGDARDEEEAWMRFWLGDAPVDDDARFGVPRDEAKKELLWRMSWVGAR